MYSSPNELPGHSRIWIYQCSRPLTEMEINLVSEETKKFLETWTAHDHALKAGFEIRYERFLILMVDEKTAGASGCSIDKSFHFVQSLERKLDVSFLDRMQFAFKRGDHVDVVSKTEFEKMFRSGTLNKDTIVFNNLIQTKQELEKNWELPVKESWHQSLISV